MISGGVVVVFLMSSPSNNPPSGLNESRNRAVSTSSGKAYLWRPSVTRESQTIDTSLQTLIERDLKERILITSYRMLNTRVSLTSWFSII